MKDSDLQSFSLERNNTWASSVIFSEPQSSMVYEPTEKKLSSSLDKEISFHDLLFSMIQLRWNHPSGTQNCEAYLSLLQQRGRPDDLKKMVEVYDQLKSLVPFGSTEWFNYDNKQFFLLTDQLYNWQDALSRSEGLFASFPQYSWPYYSRLAVLRYVIYKPAIIKGVSSYAECVNSYLMHNESAILAQLPHHLQCRNYAAILGDTALLLALKPASLDVLCYYYIALRLQGLACQNILHDIKNKFQAENPALKFTAIAKNLIQLGQYEEALRLYDDAIFLSPHLGYIYKEKATLLRFMEKKDESIFYYYQGFTKDAESRSEPGMVVPNNIKLPGTVGLKHLPLRPSKVDRLLADTGVPDVRFPPLMGPFYKSLFKHPHPGIRAILRFVSLEKQMTILIDPPYAVKRKSSTLGEYHKNHNIVSFKELKDSAVHEFCHLVNYRLELTQLFADTIALAKWGDKNYLQGRTLTSTQQAIFKQVISIPPIHYPSSEINEETVVRMAQVIVRYGAEEVARTLPSLYHFFTNIYTPALYSGVQQKYHSTLSNAVHHMISKVLDQEENIVVFLETPSATALEGFRGVIYRKWMNDAQQDKKFGDILIRNYLLRQEHVLNDLAFLAKSQLFQHQVLYHHLGVTYAVPDNIERVPPLREETCRSWQKRVLLNRADQQKQVLSYS